MLPFGGFCMAVWICEGLCMVAVGSWGLLHRGFCVAAVDS